MRREPRQTHHQERKITLAENITPIPDHRRKNLAVLVSLRRILLALVPDCPPDPKRRNRRQHAVVQNRGHYGPVLPCLWQCMRRPRVLAELRLPLPGQWKARLVA